MSDPLDIVRKCIALTASDKPGEAAAAALKACELIRKHGLEVGTNGNGKTAAPPSRPAPRPAPQPPRQDPTQARTSYWGGSSPYGPDPFGDIFGRMQEEVRKAQAEAARKARQQAYDNFKTRATTGDWTGTHDTGYAGPPGDRCMCGDTRNQHNANATCRNCQCLRFELDMGCASCGLPRNAPVHINHGRSGYPYFASHPYENPAAVPLYSNCSKCGRQIPFKVMGGGGDAVCDDCIRKARKTDDEKRREDAAEQWREEQRKKRMAKAEEVRKAQAKADSEAWERRAEEVMEHLQSKMTEFGVACGNTADDVKKIADFMKRHNMKW